MIKNVFVILALSTVLIGFIYTCIMVKIKNFGITVNLKFYKLGVILICFLIVIDFAFYYSSYHAFIFYVFIVFFGLSIILLFLQNDYEKSDNDIFYKKNNKIVNKKISLMDIFEIQVFRKEKIFYISKNIVDKNGDFIEKKDIQIKIIVPQSDWHVLNNFPLIDYDSLKKEIGDSLVRPLIRNSEKKSLKKLFALYQRGSFINIEAFVI